mgnify:FL=1
MFSAVSRNMAKMLLVAAAISAPATSIRVTAAPVSSAAVVDDSPVKMKDALLGTSSITGLADLTGLTLNDITACAVTEGSFPDDKTKIVFLYNVRTGQFINAGGYWGTHISLKDYPISLWVNTNGTGLEFAQNLETGVGSLLGWVVNDKLDADEGVFIDRKKNEDGWTHNPWTLEQVTGDAKNSFRICTKVGEANYYLCANGDKTDQDKNCEAMPIDVINNKNLTGYDLWRVFTMEQIQALQKLNSDNMTSSLDISFKLLCPGFSRGNKDIGKWKIATFGVATGGGARFGLDKLYNTTPKVRADKTYDKNVVGNEATTFGDITYQGSEDYMRKLGKYYCADAKNIRGAIYQDVKVESGGSYVIECKGFSTTSKAKLFATRLDKDGNEMPHSLHQTVLWQTEDMSEAERAALHVDEQNMDYAGKNFYGSRQYINTVLVQIPEPENEGDYNYIRFGLVIGEDKNDTTPGSGEWTVFDDFRLLYASRTIDEDLILDEDRADLEYLFTCSNNYKNKVLHLKKTLKTDKWNSFVLPVNLSRNQFRQAFGANARLAKLSNLTSNEIQFQTVNLNDDNIADKVLEAYTPYIIFPNKDMSTSLTPRYRALLTETGTGTKSHQVVIAGNHFEIPNVTLATKEDNTNDLDNIDRDTWTTRKMYSVSGNGTMEAHGTFARTFGTAEQNLDENSADYGKYTFTDRKIIDGRDNLKGSYFFDNGTLYHSDTNVRGLRGFSCWFKPVNGEPTKTSLYIDGVANGVSTDLSDVIYFGDNEPKGKAAQGIFNMQGQLVRHGSDTTGLPAGLYIVNGRKRVVE